MKPIFQIVFFLVFVASGFNHTKAEFIYSIDEQVKSFLPGAKNEIHSLLKKAQKLKVRHSDSACMLALQACHLSEKAGKGYLHAKALKMLGDIYIDLGIYLEAYEQYMGALKLINEEEHPQMSLKELEQYITLLNDIGRSYYFLDNPVKSLLFYEKALKVAKQHLEDPMSYQRQYWLAMLYNNVGSIHLHMKNYEHANGYFIKSLEFIEPDSSKTSYAAILNNLGIGYVEAGNYGKALEYHTIAQQLRIKDHDTTGIIQSKNNLGITYVKSKKYRKGIPYLESSLALSRPHNELYSARISAEALCGAYDSIGNCEKALRALQLFCQLNDSIVNSESINRMSKMEKQLAVERQIRKQELTREKQKQQQARKRSIYLMIGCGVLLLLVILALLVYMQRNKIRHQQLRQKHLELESRNLTLEKGKLQDLLEYKNKELATNVMYLVNRNEQITRIAEKLIKNKDVFKREGQKVVQSIIQELQTNSGKDAWKEFEIRFQEVHADFYKTLHERYPNLTLNEKKLTAFLRLNMTTKEISAITYQSVNSIVMARSRLRKKLGIKREENLVAFLEQL